MENEGIDYVIVKLAKLNPNGVCKHCSLAKFDGSHKDCNTCQNQPKQKIKISEYLQMIKVKQC